MPACLVRRLFRILSGYSQLDKLDVIHYSVHMRVWVLLVMLPEEVLTVVVPIWCPHHGVDVLARRLTPFQIPQCDRRLMIELDQSHRAVDAVIKDAVWFRPTDPSEPGLIQMLPHLVHLDRRVPVAHVPHILANQIKQLLLLFGCELCGADACVVKNDIILERFAHVIVAGFGDLDDGLLTLRVIKRVDQRQSLVLFVLQHGRAFVPAGVSRHWLGTHESGCHYHLIAQHEVVDGQMVSVELPAPRLLV